jgi:hypothetical protein
MELMKLSNKILFGFFGFIFIYLSAAFAELRMTGTPNVIDDKNSIAETVEIPNLAYVVLEDLAKDIHVVGSEDPELEVRSFSGDLLKNITYKVSNDTLILSDLPSEKRTNVKITLFVPKTGFKGITVNNSEVFIEGLRQQHLYISQNAGRIWLSDSKIGKVRMNASNESHLDISETRLDTLSAELQASQVQLSSSSIKLLEGSMKQNSFMRLGDVGEIQFKKDESSKLNLYQ